jgi:hypothetical protein
MRAQVYNEGAWAPQEALLRSMAMPRIFTRSTIVCVFICILLLIYGRPIGFLLLTKWELRNHPELWTVPIPLPSTAAEQVSGRTFTYFGYEFESPWTEVKLERKLSSIAILNFTNGCTIRIFNPVNGSSALEAMRQTAGERGADLASLFGKEATRSNYALRSRIFNLTPGDLRLSWDRGEMAGNSVLLVLKGIWAPKTPGGLYSFQTDWVRGFEIGDPSKTDAINIEAFDRQDNQVNLLIGSGKDAARQFQQDINVVLESLRPVSDPQSR